MLDDFDKATALRKDRSTVASHVVGLLKSLKLAAMPHQVAKNSQGETLQELTDATLAHSQVFTVRALETFFRDCFVLLCRKDPSFLKEAADSTKGKIDVSSILKIQSNSCSLEDFLSVQRNFQNLEVVNRAFEPFLGSTVFDQLDKREFDIYLLGRPSKRTIAKASSWDWRKNLFGLFESRHEIIHNANRPLPVDQELVLTRWRSASMISQLFAVMLAEKLRVGVINVPMPMEHIMVNAIAMHSESKADFEKGLSDFIRVKEQFDGHQGHIGPAIILPDDLLKTSFEDSLCDKNMNANQEVYHIIDQEDDGYVLRTLCT